MATAFNMLRSNDLIWPYVINNYLQGQEAAPVRPALLERGFDAHAGGQPLLLPAQLLSREQARPRARWRSAASSSTSSKVKIPIYNLATREDHIAPAKSVLARLEVFRRAGRFVLAGSGHIAGVVNPPAHDEISVLDRAEADRRRSRRLAREGHGASGLLVAGLAGLAQAAGPRRRCRRAQPGGGKFKPIEDAPGSYVKVRD